MRSKRRMRSAPRPPNVVTRKVCGGDGHGIPTASAPVASGVIAALNIPRLKLAAVVAGGDDEDTLKVEVGHLRT